jgi:hypothetical protein
MCARFFVVVAVFGVIDLIPTVDEALDSDRLAEAEGQFLNPRVECSILWRLLFPQELQ